MIKKFKKNKLQLSNLSVSSLSVSSLAQREAPGSMNRNAGFFSGQPYACPLEAQINEGPQEMAEQPPAAKSKGG